MSGYTLFQMTAYDRQLHIDRHLFYWEQAKERLLDQFTELEDPRNADKCIEQWLSNNAHRFNPDWHDHDDFCDKAFDFYLRLIALGNQTKLSVLAGMFHAWEKEFRDWLINEIRHWHWSEKLPTVIGKASFENLLALADALAWNIREKEYFAKLDTCRLVVNVYKHGAGSSFEQLREKYPEFFPSYWRIPERAFGNLDYERHQELTVTIEQMQGFADAIVQFWKDVPENIWDHPAIELPNWLGKHMLD